MPSPLKSRNTPVFTIETDSRLRPRPDEFRERVSDPDATVEKGRARRLASLRRPLARSAFLPSPSLLTRILDGPALNIEHP